MADNEDMGEKTERPTAHRLQEARQRGQIPRSADLSAALVLLGALLALNILGPNILSNLAGLTQRMLGGKAELTAASALGDARVGFAAAANILLPLVLAVAAAALVASVIQIGFVVSTQSLTPNFGKLNPIAGLGRLLSMRNLVKLAGNIAKVAIIGWVGYATIRSRLDSLLALVTMDLWMCVSASAELTFVLAIRIALVLLVLALLDYAYMRFQHDKDLRMSRQEIREELKRMEGDPVMRARRRNVARQLAMQRIASEVPRADVIVTNPTHVAVALKYDPKSMAAPRVLAKGADLMADHIRKLAIQHKVPIVRRAPLARAIYAGCDVGDEVPAKFYKAVAEVLAYVYELAGRGRRRTPAVRAASMAPSLN